MPCGARGRCTKPNEPPPPRRTAEAVPRAGHSRLHAPSRVRATAKTSPTPIDVVTEMAAPWLTRIPSCTRPTKRSIRVRIEAWAGAWPPWTPWWADRRRGSLDKNGLLIEGWFLPVTFDAGPEPRRSVAPQPKGREPVYRPSALDRALRRCPWGRRGFAVAAKQESEQTSGAAVDLSGWELRRAREAQDRKPLVSVEEPHRQRAGGHVARPSRC